MNDMDNDILKVALCQVDCIWHYAESNLDRAERWIADTDAHLVVLPEMFATGFSMTPERIAEPSDGRIVTRFREIARKYGKAIIVSVAIELDDAEGSRPKKGFVNRLFFFTPEGDFLTYDKRHTFRMAGEHERYESGDRRLIVYYRGFRICPLICYDLRFPVWSRCRNDYDLLVYVASWPDARRYAWSTLLRARAIENLSYCVGVNRCGEDPQNRYSGDSVALDYLGQPIAEADPYAEQVITAELSLKNLRLFRAKFPANLDADIFSIEV